MGRMHKTNARPTGHGFFRKFAIEMLKARICLEASHQFTGIMHKSNAWNMQKLCGSKVCVRAPKRSTSDGGTSVELHAKIARVV